MTRRDDLIRNSRYPRGARKFRDLARSSAAVAAAVSSRRKYATPIDVTSQYT